MNKLLFILLLITQLTHAQSYVSFLDVDVKHKKEKTTIFNNIKTVPFAIIEGMILVEANMNQQNGNYIIDTGAPTLIINEKPTANGLRAGRGISESLVTAEVTIKDFNWSGIHKTNISAYKVDISHLEKVSGKAIEGIIGYDILKEVELLVDYQNHTLQLIPIQTIKKESHQPLAIIPFTMQAHLPVIKVNIGKKKLRLALDTASERNILDVKILKKLADNCISNKQVGEIQGVDQQIKKVQVASIQQTTIEDLAFDNMSYLFTDLSHLKSESDIYIDGLLGYPFFKQRKMSINYEEQRIYVWAQ
ncbi:MAG: aspartyl protease family protein [Saprospiraceae bacterium]